MSHSNWAEWRRPEIGRERLTLEPTFGPMPGWSPDRDCRSIHPHGPMPSGSRLCCMSCHQTGVEEHPDLRETAAGKAKLLNWRPTDELGNPTTDQWSDLDTAEPTVYRADDPSKPETRRQKRAKRFVPGVEPIR